VGPLTVAGAVLGTPAYMAPEQARGDRTVTTATDVYAIGAVLYEILTGRPPFRGGSAVEILHHVVNDEPVPPSRVAPRSNRDLGLVARKCLARDPGARYQSASDVADELDRWLRGEPLLVRPLGLPTLALRWLRKNVGAALAVVGIGSVWGLSVG